MATTFATEISRNDSYFYTPWSSQQLDNNSFAIAFLINIWQLRQVQIFALSFADLSEHENSVAYGWYYSYLSPVCCVN